MTRKRDKVKETLNKDVPLPQKIAVDILGVLLIIAAVVFGWLPGVGGIPLFLAGLGLLATNHEWARNLLKEVKVRGTSIMKTVFRDHPVLVVVYDILAIVFLILAGLTLFSADGNLGRGFASVIGFFGFGLLIGNRNRIEHINKFVNKITRKIKP